MRNGNWIYVLILLSGWPSFASPRKKRLPLPAAARIQIGQKTRVAVSSPDADWCRTYTVTRGSIRHEFATYRIVTDEQKHYLYQVAPCSTEGVVVVGKRSFTWTSNPGGWLVTTYPDGVQKTLGTSDPAFLDVKNQ